MKMIIIWMSLAVLAIGAVWWQRHVAAPAVQAGTQPTCGNDLLVLELGGSSPQLVLPDVRPAGPSIPAPSQGGDPTRRTSPHREADAQDARGPQERPPAERPAPEVNRPSPAPGGPVASPRYAELGDTDTLYRIAVRELGEGARWRDIARLNNIPESQVGRLRKGTRLLLPAR